MATSTIDATQRLIESLAEPARSAAWWLVYAARSAGYPLVVTSARRSREEQLRLVQAGLSNAPNSPHIRGLAFDVDLYRTARDDVPAWFWQILGPYAETTLGLTWGGRWTHPYDPGHFEVRR